MSIFSRKPTFGMHALGMTGNGPDWGMNFCWQLRTPWLNWKCIRHGSACTIEDFGAYSPGDSPTNCSIS